MRKRNKKGSPTRRCTRFPPNASRTQLLAGGSSNPKEAFSAVGDKGTTGQSFVAPSPPSRQLCSCLLLVLGASSMVAPPTESRSLASTCPPKLLLGPGAEQRACMIFDSLTLFLVHSWSYSDGYYCFPVYKSEKRPRLLGCYL